MKVLSLFDGMSCGQIALNRLKVDIETYYAAEIDKFAIEITQKNYPDTIQLGDVTKWQDWDIDWSSIDLVSGGFPCQAWSIAGKQQGDRDPRGMLFWTMLDIIQNVLKHNPKAYFLMENVKMKQEFEQYITKHTEAALGVVNKHLINSSLVSAQSRQRYYWTNIPNIVQPEDKGIILKDILESNPNNCVMMSDKFTTRNKDRNCLVDGTTKEKASNLSAMEYLKNGRQGDYISCDDEGTPIPNPELMRETPNYWQFDTSGKGYKSQQDRIRKLDVPSNTLSAGTASVPKIWYEQPKSYRKLTPTECERLQTVPDGYTEGVSNSQRYKMLGNGWTVDVIKHIYKFMLDNES